MDEIKETIKQARKAHDLNRAEFAELLGVADGTVGMWESGASRPSFETAYLFSFDVREPEWVCDLFKTVLEALLETK